MDKEEGQDSGLLDSGTVNSWPDVLGLGLLWGLELVGDRHILTHTSICSNNIKHTFIVTVGIRMSTRTLRRRSSIPRTSVIMER